MSNGFRKNQASKPVQKKLYNPLKNPEKLVQNRRSPFNISLGPEKFEKL